MPSAAVPALLYTVLGGLLVIALQSVVRWLLENRGRYTGTYYDCLYDEHGNMDRRDILRLRNLPGGIQVTGRIRGELATDPAVDRTKRKWMLAGRMVGHDFIAHFWSTEPGVRSYGAWLVHHESDCLFRGAYLKWDDDVSPHYKVTRLLVVRQDRWKEEYRKWPM